MERRTLHVQQGKKSITYPLSSLKKTAHIAHELAHKLQGGTVIALEGDLGSGKTTLTQFLAKELGVRERVTSPTFVIMNLYAVRKKEARMNGIRHLCHIDAYRIQKAEDLQAVGAQDYIGRHDTLTVIEWAERVRELIPKKAIWIVMAHSPAS